MTRCKFCNEYVQWLTCKDGKRRMFSGDPIPVEQDTGADGWVTGRHVIRGRERVVMTRINHVSAGKRAAVRRVVVLHACPEYRRLVEAAYGPPAG